MSNKLPEQPNSEEVDLGQLFKLIGNAFNRFFKFIGSILNSFFLKCKFQNMNDSGYNCNLLVCIVL